MANPNCEYSGADLRPPERSHSWSSALHSKCSIGATLSRVRIPPSPPKQRAGHGSAFCFPILATTHRKFCDRPSRSGRLTIRWQHYVSEESTMARGNFGNPQQHARAGHMSSGNRGNSAQHAEAGRKGARAQPTEAKAKGGRMSHGGGRRKSSEQ